MKTLYVKDQALCKIYQNFKLIFVIVNCSSLPIFEFLKRTGTAQKPRPV